MRCHVLVVSALLLAAACTARPRTPIARPQPLARAVQRSAPPSFITTFWCGPPLDLFDDARAAEIAAGGFTIVGPPCEGERNLELTRQGLEVAARHGLRMWVADARFDEHAPERPGWEAALDVAVAEYRDRPGFGGYFITDEPDPRQFGNLAALVERLRSRDPDHLAYVNLRADYGIVGAGAESYRDYVEGFLRSVRPALLSYDYYPFGIRRDRPTFFTSLALMRELSAQDHVPFMLIVLAMPHAVYRDPTDAELRWQTFHALAYGARGISYFAYWTPVHVEYADVMKFRHGLIENGTPTRHYAEAARINRAALAFEAELDGFHSVSIADSTGQVAPRPPVGPIDAIDGGPTTIGLFADEAGRLAALIVNRDYRQAANLKLRLRAGQPLPERFNPDALNWTQDRDGSLQLVPGGAALIRWVN